MKKTSFNFPVKYSFPKEYVDLQTFYFLLWLLLGSKHLVQLCYSNALSIYSLVTY